MLASWSELVIELRLALKWRLVLALQWGWRSVLASWSELAIELRLALKWRLVLALVSGLGLQSALVLG
ncbi:hypothetical protein [Halobellus marinus]|uniref:hypothetical protein n=1 Tax=Halobellus TaxID=1073986 RepID=UPI0028AA8D05|nr:hypothetical protein [Halobellus sp. DFY28]